MVWADNSSAPVWAEQPIVLLESRCVGVLARNQLGEHPAVWPGTIYDRPLPGKVCFRSVKRKLDISWKTRRLETYFSKLPRPFPDCPQQKDNIIYISLASSKLILAHYPAWTLPPPRHAQLSILIYGEIKAQKGYMICPRSHSLYIMVLGLRPSSPKRKAGALSTMS